MGAAADASLRTVFRPLVASAIEARKLILREFAQIPKEIAGTARAGLREQAAAFRGSTAEARAASREQVALAREAGRAEAAEQRRAKRETAIATRLALREMKADWKAYEGAARRSAQEVEREARRAARSAAAETRRQARELDRFATRTSYHSARFLTPHAPIASMARRAGSEVLRGIGLDTTASGAFQRNVALETAAVQATNSARLSGQNVDPAAVQAAVRATQKKFGTGTDTVGALEQFQKVTGDLKLGMDLLDQLALRSATSGAKMDDLAAAAANVSNNLGNVPNKGAAVLAILDQFTVQGAQGAVEISDMAKEAAKLAAAAPQFKGDTADNMRLLGAMAQVARSQGGAASAQQAATSVMSFSNTFTKGARLKALEKAGIQAIDPATKQIMNPRELVKQILTKSGGDPLKMNTMVMDVQAKRAIRGFQVEYNKAGGGTAGLAAVDKLFDKFMRGGISDETRQANLDAHNNSTAVRVAKFQATLDQVAQTTQSRLLPALEKLAPHAEAFAVKMGDLVTYMAENPGKAVVGALVLAIGRAGIESALRALLERMILGGMRGVPGSNTRGVGPGRQAAGTAATALALLGVGVAVDQAYKLGDEIGPRASKRLKTDALDLLPGFNKGKFSGPDYVGDIASTTFGMISNPLGTARQLFNTAHRKVGNLETTGSFANIDALKDQDARSKFKAQKQAEASSAITADEEFRNSKVVSRYRAAPGETAEDLKQRFKNGTLDGGNALLVAQQKMQIEQTGTLNKNIAALNQTLQTIDFGGDGGEPPKVNERGRES